MFLSLGSNTGYLGCFTLGECVFPGLPGHCRKGGATSGTEHQHLHSAWHALIIMPDTTPSDPGTFLLSFRTIACRIPSRYFTSADNEAQEKRINCQVHMKITLTKRVNMGLSKSPMSVFLALSWPPKSECIYGNS